MNKLTLLINILGALLHLANYINPGSSTNPIGSLVFVGVHLSLIYLLRDKPEKEWDWAKIKAQGYYWCECESWCVFSTINFKRDKEGHHPNCKKHKG